MNVTVLVYTKMSSECVSKLCEITTDYVYLLRILLDMSEHTVKTVTPNIIIIYFNFQGKVVKQRHLLS